MSQNTHPLPEELLGLPSRESSRIDDDDIRAKYRQYLGQLQVVYGGNVILSNPYCLSVKNDGISKSTKNWLAALTNSDKATLLLLSIIARPFDAATLWPENQQRFSDNDLIQVIFSGSNTTSLSDHQFEIPFGLDNLSQRKKVLADEGLKQIMDAIPVNSPIETLSAEFIGGQPGNYGYQMWQISAWSDNWAVVFCTTDTGDEGYPFPWLLGFCRRNHTERIFTLERNFIELLRRGGQQYDIGFYNTYGKVYGKWGLAKLALHVEEEYEELNWDLLDDLFTLDENLLNTIISKNETDDAEYFLKKLRRIRESADEIGFSDLSIADLLDKAGGVVSLDEIEAKLPEWEAEQEEIQQEILAPFKESIEAYVNIIVEPYHGSSATAGMGWRIGRGRVFSYLTNYVLEHRELPSGKHELGGSLGIINFDEIDDKT